MRIFSDRARLLLTEADPVFANWDQDDSARRARYAEQDPARVAVELADTAAAASSTFAAVRPEEWARTGTRSNGSAFSVDSLARYLLHDVVHHLTGVRA